MKKRIVIGILFALLCCLEAQAQGQYRKPLKSSNQSILGFSNYNIGLKIGCPWSVMLKSDLNNTAYDGHVGYLIGILGERNFGRWSVGLESISLVAVIPEAVLLTILQPYQIWSSKSLKGFSDTFCL